MGLFDTPTYTPIPRKCGCRLVNNKVPDDATVQLYEKYSTRMLITSLDHFELGCLDLITNEIKKCRENNIRFLIFIQPFKTDNSIVMLLIPTIDILDNLHPPCKHFSLTDNIREYFLNNDYHNRVMVVVLERENNRFVVTYAQNS